MGATLFVPESKVSQAASYSYLGDIVSVGSEFTLTDTGDITWQVVAKDANNITLVSKYVIENCSLGVTNPTSSYNSNYNNVTGITVYSRPDGKMNNDYLGSAIDALLIAKYNAFSTNVKKYIQPKAIPWLTFGTRGLWYSDGDTETRYLYIPTFGEVESWWSGTAAKKTLSNGKGANWYTRTPHYTSKSYVGYYARYVAFDGSLYESGQTICAKASHTGSSMGVVPNCVISSQTPVIGSGGSYTVVNKVSLHYDTNGGSSIASANLYEGANYILPGITPTKPNAYFLGWFAQATEGTRVTEQNIMPGSDITIYAHWKQGRTITFNANGGSFG